MREERNFFNRVSEFLGRYFVALVVIIACLALIVPNPFLILGKMRFVGQSLVSLCLGIIMFVMGLTLNKRDFQVVLTNPRDIFIGCLAQFTIMPLGAFFLAKIFNLPIGNVCSPK